MTHRACIIAVTGDLGIPKELIHIIVFYAELSHGERINIMFQSGDVIELVVDEPTPDYFELHRMLIQKTEYGMVISTTVTKNYEYMTRFDFIGIMNYSYILDYQRYLDTHSVEFTIFEKLLEKLVALWWSF